MMEEGLLDFRKYSFNGVASLINCDGYNRIRPTKMNVPREITSR